MTAAVGDGAHLTARIRLVVVSGGRQRSSVKRLRRSTPTTTPTGRSRVMVDVPPVPDTTGKEAS